MEKESSSNPAGKFRPALYATAAAAWPREGSAVAATFPPFLPCAGGREGGGQGRRCPRPHRRRRYRLRVTALVSMVHCGLVGLLDNGSSSKDDSKRGKRENPTFGNVLQIERTWRHSGRVHSTSTAHAGVEKNFPPSMPALPGRPSATACPTRRSTWPPFCRPAFCTTILVTVLLQTTPVCACAGWSRNEASAQCAAPRPLLFRDYWSQIFL